LERVRKWGGQCVLISSTQNEMDSVRLILPSFVYQRYKRFSKEPTNMMISRSVVLGCFLAGSSAAFAVHQPAPPAYGVRSKVIESSNVLRMSGGQDPELSVRNVGNQELCPNMNPSTIFVG
jgi:hypothetical protein